MDTRYQKIPLLYPPMIISIVLLINIQMQTHLILSDSYMMIKACLLRQMENQKSVIISVMVGDGEFAQAFMW